MKLKYIKTRLQNTCIVLLSYDITIFVFYFLYTMCKIIPCKT